MYRLLLVTIFLLTPIAVQAKATKGWLDGKIVPGEKTSEPTVIYLEDGTQINADSPSDVFTKLLHHWSAHRDRTTFEYKLGARYNNLQEFTIRYFVNGFGGFQWHGTHSIATDQTAKQ